MPSFWVTGTTRFESVDIICQIWPIRGYTRSWYTGTGRLKKWLQAPPPSLPSSLPFYFRVCAFKTQRTRLSRSLEQANCKWIPRAINLLKSLQEVTIGLCWRAICSVLCPLIQPTVDIALVRIIFEICNCQISMAFVLKWRHIKSSLSWDFLIFSDWLLLRKPIYHWLGVVPVVVIKKISNAQERLTAHGKGMQTYCSTNRNRLKWSKMTAIPLVNGRVDIVLHKGAEVCKGEKSRTVVTEWLHISGSICLKRLQFDKSLPWPLEDNWLTWILLLYVNTVCKSNESFIADCKSLAIRSPVGRYVLNLFKFAAVPFVDEWVDAVGGVITKIWNGKKLLICYFEEVNAVCSKCFNALKDDKLFLNSVCTKFHHNDLRQPGNVDHQF